MSAVIAHLAIGEGFELWGWAAGTSILWALSVHLAPGGNLDRRLTTAGILVNILNIRFMNVRMLT